MRFILFVRGGFRALPSHRFGACPFFARSCFFAAKRGALCARVFAPTSSKKLLCSFGASAHRRLFGLVRFARFAGIFGGEWGPKSALFFERRGGGVLADVRRAGHKRRRRKRRGLRSSIRPMFSHTKRNELRFLKFRLISRIYRPKMVRGRIIVRP